MSQLDKYTFDYIENNNLLLFKCITGSHAYGTNTETSDIDTRGVYVCKFEDLLGFKEVPTEVSDKKQDNKYYEIGTFFKLLMKSNPNLLEVLNVSPEHMLQCHPLFQKYIIDNRDLFVSKLCRDTFAGYAVSQIKKAKGLNKKIVNPMPKERKDLLDFCYVIDEDKTYPLKKLLTEKNVNQMFVGVEKSNHAQDIYFLYYDKMSESNFTDNSPETLRHREANKAEGNQMGYGFKGIVNPNAPEDTTQIRLSSIPEIKKGINDKLVEFLCLISYNQGAYSRYVKEYNEYWKWVKNRNEARYTENVDNNCEYDCYLDSETEYLTNSGWKKYDNITESDLLATLNSEHTLVYEKYLDRFKKEYTGKIFNYEKNYTRFSVTPNHNLYFSNCHRNPSTNFSIKYFKDKSNWKFENVEEFFKNKRSYHHILITPENYNIVDYPVSDDFIKLLGSYLSEGSLGFNKLNIPHIPLSINISQAEGNRLCNFMDSIKEYIFSIGRYLRDDGRVELVYRLNNKELAQKFYNECGYLSQNMKLPNYVFNFSKRQVQLLLDVLVAGDGHNHKNGNIFYFSSSSNLINGINLLLFINGIHTQIYGPYKDKRGEKYLDKYQLYIPKKQSNVSILNKRFNSKHNTKKSGWTEIFVTNEYVSCFTLSTGLLITRNKNKIAIQGNSKNMGHCIRLLNMCLDLFQTNQIVVKRPEREFLLDIRNHKYEYDYIINLAESRLKEIDESVKTSTLQDTPDEDKLQTLLIEMRKEFNKK